MTTDTRYRDLLRGRLNEVFAHRADDVLIADRAVSFTGADLERGLESWRRAVDSQIPEGGYVGVHVAPSAAQGAAVLWVLASGRVPVMLNPWTTEAAHLDAGTVAAIVLPLHHTTGLNTQFLPTIFAGGLAVVSHSRWLMGRTSMALAHCLLEEMYRRRFGRIVFLSSIAARFARRGRASYAAAKAGLEGFTRSLALEVAHRGITVNAVAPGLIATPMTESLVADLEAGGRLRRAIPAGRAGEPADVAALVRFLCSADAGYITGTVLPVDGGRTLGDAG